MYCLQRLVYQFDKRVCVDLEEDKRQREKHGMARA